MDTMWAALPDPDRGVVGLSRVAKPRPAADEVVVEVMAAGMNRADLLHAKGRYVQRLRSADRPDIAGMELAGRIVEVGTDVDPSLIGQRVMGMFPGAYAQYAAVPVDLLLEMPADLGWVEAAGTPMALLTEYEALVRLADATTEDRVLLTAATSGVGLVGVQLARHLGIRPMVTSRDVANDKLLHSLGATAVAHTSEELASLLPEGVDIVVDHVGGDVLEMVQFLLRDHARVVSVGRLDRRSAQLDLAAFAGRRASLIGSTWRCQTRAEVARTVAGVKAEVLDAVGAGAVRPIIGAVVALQDIEASYEQLSGPRTPGKVVVACHEDALEAPSAGRPPFRCDWPRRS